jgi:DUF1365 family protein
MSPRSTEAPVPLASALYAGTVTHRRLRPREHFLAYRLYSFLLDLDELERIDRELRFFSVNRFNLFSFYERDRGEGGATPLRERVEARLSGAGLETGGPIRLLTMPRLLGWAFNPLSIFFCYRRDGALSAILWEVDNTFGQRHGYLIPVEQAAGETIHQRCDKAFYVSPFMDMDQRYAFTLDPPGELLRISIDVSDRQGPMMLARQLGRRQELTDAALLRQFFALPALTLRVVGGILWEALKIRLKGIRTRPLPAPPAEPVSIVSPLSTKSKADAV